MKAKGKDVVFGIAKDKEIQRTEGTMLTRGNCRCPVCQQPTPVKDLRQAGRDGRLGERLVAIIIEKPEGKDYRPPDRRDLEATEEAERLAAGIQRPTEPILPEITQRGEEEEDVSNSTGIRVHQYGFKTWGSVFNSRQLVAVQTFTDSLCDITPELHTNHPEGYQQAVACYLAMWVDKLTVRMTAFTRWNNIGENFEQPFDTDRSSLRFFRQLIAEVRAVRTATSSWRSVAAREQSTAAPVPDLAICGV
jgi:adenine-specific DNA methylase